LSHPPVVSNVYEKTKRGVSEFRLNQSFLCDWPMRLL
jgi:hypothetical protein